MTAKETSSDLTPAALEQRGAAGLRHGARSEDQILSRARAHRRRLLRQIGLTAGQLDPIALGYLDLWARAMSKVSLYDDWANEHGWLDGEGNPPGFVATYMAALNSARLSLAKLEDHLKARGEPSMVLEMQARRVER